jgi:hypothetical protein
VTGYSTVDTGFLPVGCDGSTAAAVEGIASKTTIEADVDAGAGALE